MTQNNFNQKIGKITPKRRRGVAEVISTLLLVVITVVGAVILTGFIDETFVSGSFSVASGTDSTIKKIKLRAYDTRDGTSLMGYDISNEHSINPKLCGQSCSHNDIPANGGTEFLVIQIENQAVNSVFLKNLYLDGVNYDWDNGTAGNDLDGTGSPVSGVTYPSDGTFSILSDDGDPAQLDSQIAGGSSVNLVVKLDAANSPDLDLSKTVLVKLNIGENSLAEFLIETGDAR